MEWEAVSVGLLSVLPPIVAIVLALITKEVVFSLVLEPLFIHSPTVTDLSASLIRPRL